MKPPRPELHTYFDKEQGERVFYACEQLEFDNGEVLVVIPKLFISDGLSIPRIFQNVISKSPFFIYAGILHDYLYKVNPCKQMKRKQADKLFLAWMKIYGVGWIKRHTIYRSVRIGGRGSWKKKFAKFATNKHHD
jgi:hypothetical protein